MLFCNYWSRCCVTHTDCLTWLCTSCLWYRDSQTKLFMFPRVVNITLPLPHYIIDSDFFTIADGLVSSRESDMCKSYCIFLLFVCSFIRPVFSNVVSYQILIKFTHYGWKMTSTPANCYQNHLVIYLYCLSNFLTFPFHVSASLFIPFLVFIPTRYFPFLSLQ